MGIFTHETITYRKQYEIGIGICENGTINFVIDLEIPNRGASLVLDCGRRHHMDMYQTHELNTWDEYIWIFRTTKVEDMIAFLQEVLG